MKGKLNLNSISIILVRPKFPENVGSVARAMKNMGLNRLLLVDGCSPLHMNAYKLASGAEDILERAEEFQTLREAVSEMGRVVGTTSRRGKERSPLLTPAALLKKIIPLSEKNSIGIVFGSEKEGLTNEELSLCHLYVRIPSLESFPSLNLAQAVMVLCYELFQSSMTIQKHPIPLAKAEQLERMFEHMERTLLNIGFLDAKNPKRIMRVLRKLFGRSEMEEREVRILEGIWSKMDWHMNKKRRAQSIEKGGDESMLKKWLRMILCAFCVMGLLGAKLSHGSIPLPNPSSDGNVSVERTIKERRTIRDFKDRVLSLNHLSQLLWAAQGITDPNGMKRATPSAGALYPLDIYVIVGEEGVKGMEAGVYHYLSKTHEILSISKGDRRKEIAAASLRQMWMAQAPVIFIITAEYKRITWKYGERGLRYALIEVGHVGQNLFLQAEALGLGVGIVGAFYDQDVSKVMGTPSQHEPLLIMPVGYKK